MGRCVESYHKQYQNMSTKIQQDTELKILRIVQDFDNFTSIQNLHYREGVRETLYENVLCLKLAIKCFPHSVVTSCDILFLRITAFCAANAMPCSTWTKDGSDPDVWDSKPEYGGLPVLVRFQPQLTKLHHRCIRTTPKSCVCTLPETMC